MNEKFFELPKEKQLNIINAGMEVFGQYEYKRAVTDEIAAKAGISKGLLFYYFHNKHGLYMYLYNYCLEVMNSLVLDEGFKDTTDFFEVIEYGVLKTTKLLSEVPHIMNFVMRAYYSQNEAISEEVSTDIQRSIQEGFTIYFGNVDNSKFKPEYDPSYIYQMLCWIKDGYLHERQILHKPIDLDEIMNEYHKWKEIFRNMVYKEEYL